VPGPLRQLLIEVADLPDGPATGDRGTVAVAEEPGRLVHDAVLGPGELSNGVVLLPFPRDSA
jgi:hypothetical protein